MVDSKSLKRIGLVFIIVVSLCFLGLTFQFKRNNEQYNHLDIRAPVQTLVVLESYLERMPDRLRFSYVMVNTTEEPVIIKNVELSCACLGVKYRTSHSSESLQSDSENGELRRLEPFGGVDLVLEAARPRGPTDTRYSAVIHTNSKNAHYAARVEALVHVLQDVITMPALLEFGPADTSRDLSIALLYDRLQDAHDDEVMILSEDPRLSVGQQVVSMSEIRKYGRSYVQKTIIVRIARSIDDSKLASDYATAVRIQSKQKHPFWKDVRVKVQVSKKLKVTPSRLYFDFREPNAPEKIVVARMTDNSPFTITGMHRPEGVRIQQITSGQRSLHLLKIWTEWQKAGRPETKVDASSITIQSDAFEAEITLSFKN